MERYEIGSMIDVSEHPDVKMPKDHKKAECYNIKINGDNAPAAPGCFLFFWKDDKRALFLHGTDSHSFDAENPHAALTLLNRP